MGLTSTLLWNLVPSLGILVAALGFAFCWYQWRVVRAYGHFPSERFDIKWLFRLIMGRFPQDVPISSVLFQEIMKSCKRFQEEGMTVLWLVRPYLFVYSEDIMKTLCQETAVTNKSGIYEIVKEFIGNGLLGSEEELWKVHRKLLNPAFRRGVLKGNMHIFNRNAEDLVEKLQDTVDKPTEETLRILKRCNFNIILASILGLNLEDEIFGRKGENFLKTIDKGAELVVYRVSRPWLQKGFLLPFFSAGRKYLEEINNMRAFMCEVMEEMQKSVLASGKVENSLDNEKEVKKSLAEILIEQHVHHSTFTKEEVRDHLANFIVAGYDTSSITMMWFLYVLGHHPEVQKKACEEIGSVVMGDDVTYDDLGKLKYLECVIKETLRLYPTVPMYARNSSKEIQCGKYKIPKGTDIVFCLFMLHRNPDIYPDPEKFDPERFANCSDIRPWVYTPFAEGYRHCIGKKFAMMEMKVLLVHVLRRFEIKSLDKVEDRHLDWNIILKTTKPLRMLFKSRLP